MIFFPRDYIIVNFSGSLEEETGLWKEYRTPEITIQADAQPMSSKEVDQLNIGRRELGKIKIYTDETLQLMRESDEGKESNGTYFKFDNGEWYEVIQDITRKGGLINHNKYIAELRKNEEIEKIPCLQ